MTVHPNAVHQLGVAVLIQPPEGMPGDDIEQVGIFVPHPAAHGILIADGVHSQPGFELLNPLCSPGMLHLP
ncbi:hypothetical protein D3C76_1732010 [compost metagenome]